MLANVAANFFAIIPDFPTPIKTTFPLQDCSIFTRVAVSESGALIIYSTAFCSFRINPLMSEMTSVLFMSVFLINFINNVSHPR